MDFAALAAAAGPQGGAGGVVPGRVLAIDGDGLAYYCAGNDETDIGLSRYNLNERIRTAIAASRCERAVILLTAPGSAKGDRYALASAQPYQGKRTHGHRPKNWGYLRQILQGGKYLKVGVHDVELRQADYLEADDLFAVLSNDCGPENFVISTQDKDMRMVPGWHLNWTDWSMYYVAPDLWHGTHNGKVFGKAWFWYQMMHGDDVDNIPGLPGYYDGAIVKSGPNKGQLKLTKVGDKWPGLEEFRKVGSDNAAFLLAASYYKQYYQGDGWLSAMMEQAVLLYIRPEPSWESVFNGPMVLAYSFPSFGDNLSVLRKRVFDYATTQDNRD
jgi:hypothetical protein